MTSYDALMLDVWRELLFDLSQSSSATTGLFRNFERVLSSSRSEARAYSWPSVFDLPPDVAKAVIQARDFGKRWIFTDDLYTQEALALNAEKDFIKAQEAVCTSIPDSQRVFLWLREARRVVTQILGPYDQEEHNSCCRFGKKAALKLPRTSAYLYNRFSTLSGTQQQAKLFARIVRQDTVLRTAIKRCSDGSPKLQIVRSSVAQAVPKSYKANRLIMADSVLGGFISNGFGKLLERKLRERGGIDIRSAQQLHKKLARSASLTGSLVTADMSRASDNISWPLLARVVPTRWLRVIRYDRIATTGFTDAILRQQTVMGMGKGYTFPLQTLVFYSLLRSIANLLKRTARIQVYGDDLIYPHWMHAYVVTLFPHVGLKLNHDKTFSSKPETIIGGHSLKSGRVWRGCFRESCGGDYLCGVDVRPYQPKLEEGEEVHTRKGRIAVLNKLLNGLLEKWDPFTIRRTCRYLLKELQSACWTNKGIFTIPNDHGVYSGIKESSVVKLKDCFGDEFVFLSPVEIKQTLLTDDCTFTGYTTLRYRCLSSTRGRTVVSKTYQCCYYWDWLARRAQGEADGPLDTVVSQCVRNILTSVGLQHTASPNDLYTDAPEVLQRIRCADGSESDVVDCRDQRTFGWRITTVDVPIG